MVCFEMTDQAALMQRSPPARDGGFTIKQTCSGTVAECLAALDLWAPEARGEAFLELLDSGEEIGTRELAELYAGWKKGADHTAT